MSEQENILTSEEMDALLPNAGDDMIGGPVGEREKKNRAVPYNFRRPDRLSKEQIRALYLLHDQFAQSLSSSLPLQLQTVVEVELVSVDQSPYSDYVRSLTDPAIIFKCALEPLGGLFAIDLSPNIAFPIIDRMLGGAGAETQESYKAATDLELKILEGFIGTVIETYGAAWKPITEIKTMLAGHETRPQTIQITAPNEIVILTSYQIQVGDARGTMSFCLPAVMLEPVIDKFNQSSYATSSEPDPAATHSLLKVLSTVRLAVTAELAKTPAAVSDLASLTVGDVVRTAHRIDRSVNIKIGGLTKFSGTVASFDNRMVIQVTKKAEPKLAENN